MFKILSGIPDRDIYIITNSPSEKYTNSKIKIKERTDEIIPLNEYEKNGIASDDFLGSSISKYLDQIFIEGRHNNLDIYYLSQSSLGLPKTTIRKNSNKIILFNETLQDIENLYRKASGLDSSYSELNQLCRKSWEDENKNLCIDRSKERDQGKYCFCEESKNTSKECTPRKITF